MGCSLQGREIGLTSLGEGAQLTLFLAVLHGDEPAGQVLLGRLADHLRDRPDLLKGRRALICPVVNPDGLAAGTRANAGGVDINRNFPAANWARQNPGGRYWGGPEPGSEPETRLIVEMLEHFRPAKIVTIHAPLHNLNYDGPARGLAEAMAQSNGYSVQPDIGYATPGSLGSYAGCDRGIPTITLELPEGDGQALWETNREALVRAMLF